MPPFPAAPAARLGPSARRQAEAPESCPVAPESDQRSTCARLRPLRPHCRGSTWAETKRAPRLSVSAKLHETPVHHHDPSSASGGPHLLSAAQLPRVKRAARFQRKLKRPRGALGRRAWGCGFIPAWHASSARSRRAVRAAIDHFAAVNQSGSAPHVRLSNTRARGDFVALPSRWAPRHVAQEGPLYRVFKSRCTLGTGATSVAAGSSAVTPPFHTSCAGSVTRGGDN